MGNNMISTGADPDTQEAKYSRSQVQNIVNAVVPKQEIMDAMVELANKAIQNIGKRPYIKRIADITITYDTPPEKVDRALGILKELLENHEGMKKDYPPRIFFNDFNAASLNLRVMYWYHPPDYWAFMNFTEKFNKKVFRRFNEEGIEFAFPTQTLYLAGDASRPLSVGIGNASVNVEI